MNTRPRTARPLDAGNYPDATEGREAMTSRAAPLRNTLEKLPSFPSQTDTRLRLALSAALGILDAGGTERDALGAVDVLYGLDSQHLAGGAFGIWANYERDPRTGYMEPRK